MTTISRLLATGFAAASAVAVGFAAAAHADPPLLNGTYAGGDAENYWTIRSSCGASGCTATVASNQGWTVPATFAGGRWNFTITKPDGVICDDGSYEPATIDIAVDPVTLGGVLSADSNYGCPGGVISQTPFRLTKVS